MSDSWQGPGWRRAEDGKWYPDPNWVDPGAPPAPPFAPPVAPGASAAAPPPPPPPPPSAPIAGSSPIGGLPAPPPSTSAYAPVAGYGYVPMPIAVRPLNGKLAGWLQGLFYAVGAASLVAMVAAISAKGAFESFMSVRGGYDDLQSWRDADGLFSALTLLGTAVRIALLVVMIVWSWLAYRAADSLAPGHRKWRIGWTIGAWFIPCASIILPKLVLDETEKIASSPRTQGVAVGWKTTTTSVIGWVWWIGFIVASGLVMQGNFVTIDVNAGGSADHGEISGYYTKFIIGFVLSAISAVCGALYVRRVSRQLSAASFQASGVGYGTFGAAGAPTSTVMGGPSVASAPSAAVDAWATATASADTFCEICRQPLSAASFRCPRCGKRRQPTETASAASPPPPPPEPPTPWGPAPPLNTRSPFANGTWPPPGATPTPPGQPGSFAAPPMPGSGPTKEPASTRKILGIIGVSFLLLVLVCLVAVTLLGRSSTNDTAGGAQDVGSSSSYSDVQHKAFVDSCVQAGGATRGQCECAFTVVEGMYAPDELDKVGADYERTGVYPAELTSAIRSRCA